MYEVSVGLFKGASAEARERVPSITGKVPLAGAKVHYRFDGEYWSDEIQDYEVRVADRCLR